MMGEGSNKKISVVIPTFNQLSRLKLTLASIDTQNMDFDKFEVVIVNDGSTDGSASYLNERKTDWRLRVINQANRGRAAARNAGALAAEGEYILFCDDDCIMSPDFIAEHYNCQKARSRVLHGQIVTLTHMKFFDNPSDGSLMYPYNAIKAKKASKNGTITEEDIKENFELKIASNKRLNSIEKLIKEIFKRKAEAIYWIGFTGGNVSMPRDWLKSVGMFNESFGKSWGCEDLELGYRLQEKGYEISYSDKAVNYHIAHARFDFNKEVELSFGSFAALYDDKNIDRLKDYLLGTMDIKTIISLNSTNEN